METYTNVEQTEIKSTEWKSEDIFPIHTPSLIVLAYQLNLNSNIRPHGT